MKFPEGWELKARPTHDYPTMHILYQRDRGAVAAIAYAENPSAPGGGGWEFWPMKGAGATAETGHGFQIIDTAAALAMRAFWVPVVEEPDLSELDDDDYEYARYGAPLQ